MFNVTLFINIRVCSRKLGCPQALTPIPSFLCLWHKDSPQIIIALKNNFFICSWRPKNIFILLRMFSDRRSEKNICTSVWQKYRYGYDMVRGVTVKLKSKTVCLEPGKPLLRKLFRKLQRKIRSTHFLYSTGE